VLCLLLYVQLPELFQVIKQQHAQALQADHKATAGGKAARNAPRPVFPFDSINYEKACCPAADRM
jgi:hypothetical protein